MSITPLPLSSLLEDVASIAKGNPDAMVEDIAYDSRHCGPGAVFVAMRCFTHDGHDFTGDAYDRGCRCFAVEKIPEDLADKDDATIAVVPNSRHALAAMSQRWFGYPDRKLKVVALTGTKGKTTTSYMLKAMLDEAGFDVGLIGSNGVFYDGTKFKLLNTTPESHELNRILADMVDKGVEIVIMEATSQGFKMHRTDGIQFDLSVFTNIAPDHISPLEHTDFDEYLACKKQIFAQSELCFVNRDADLFDKIVEGVECPLQTYGFDPDCAYRATGIESVTDGHRLFETFDCKAPGWVQPMSLNIPGAFNVSNALAAVAVADRLGVAPDVIARGLAKARVAGRVEVVETPAPYTIIIDFAHNKLSIEALMATAKAYHPRRILAVFGLEGDRAHFRRFDCGEVLGRDVDYTILSDASPRRDDPDQILADIATGIERGGGTGKYEIIRDRHVSIPKILDMAGPGDIVLLVGKGNVLYEEVYDDLIPIDEREIIKDYFAARSS